MCIIAASALGYYFLGLGLASAVLLDAILAPTDSVLASDFQVGPSNDDMSEAKFSLTAEAGLNDGVAFPFTILGGKQGSFFEWFAIDVIYKITAGIIFGFLCGKGQGILLFKISKKYEALNTRDGLVALAATLFVYGITEIIHAYEFIGVFICAITLRHFEKDSQYHDKFHSFTD